MNDQKLLELKGWGHQLFTLEFQRRKITKNELYEIIKKKIGRNPHFAQMKTEEEVQEVINLLLKWLKTKPKKKKKATGNAKIPPNPQSKTSINKKEMKELMRLNKYVPYSEIQKAIRALKKIKIPWYKKLLNKIMKYTSRYL